LHFIRNFFGSLTVIQLEIDALKEWWNWERLYSYCFREGDIQG